VLDGHGKIGWGRSETGGDPIVVVLSENVSDAHLAGLRSEGVSYIFAGKSDIDLALTLDILNRELGVKRIVLEGGGGANGAFLRAGLVDELHLILCPAVMRLTNHAEKCARNGRLPCLQAEFPVPSKFFPVLRNIFPVNLRRELLR
jgi:riboflavin biosynthesis pyrimidine reductase